MHRMTRTHGAEKGKKREEKRRKKEKKKEKRPAAPHGAHRRSGPRSRL